MELAGVNEGRHMLARLGTGHTGTKVGVEGRRPRAPVVKSSLTPWPKLIRGTGN